MSYNLMLDVLASPEDLYICDKVMGSEFILPLDMLPLSQHMCIEILSRLNVAVQLFSFKRAQMFFNRLTLNIRIPLEREVYFLHTGN